MADLITLSGTDAETNLPGRVVVEAGSEAEEFWLAKGFTPGEPEPEEAPPIPAAEAANAAPAPKSSRSKK